MEAKRGLKGAKVLNKCFEGIVEGDSIPAYWYRVEEDNGATLEVSSGPINNRIFFTVSRNSVVVIE